MVVGAEADALDIKKETLPVETVTKIDARDVGTPDDWVPPPPSPTLATTSPPPPPPPLRHRLPRRHPRLRRPHYQLTATLASAALATTLTATLTTATTGAAQVPRHEKMVRLTGRHPFNVEAPLPELWKRGFLTPASLHYVRNHGAVPKIAWSEHRLTVDGMVGAPKTFTMDDLLAMPARELPVTLVCAGNRRKEENLVKQTIGFNWGAAGVSTSVWKGVLLREVLLKCGVKTPAEGAHHVCFLGSEVMPKGRYGTSITWHTAMDPACDVLLAYEQNGEKP